MLVDMTNFRIGFLRNYEIRKETLFDPKRTEVKAFQRGCN